VIITVGAITGKDVEIDAMVLLMGLKLEMELHLMKMEIQISQ